MRKPRRSRATSAELSHVELPDLGLVTATVMSDMLTAVKGFNAEAKTDFMATNAALRTEQESVSADRIASDLEVLEATKENAGRLG